MYGTILGELWLCETGDFQNPSFSIGANKRNSQCWTLVLGWAIDERCSQKKKGIYYSNVDFRFVGNKVCEVRDWRKSKDLAGCENNMIVEGGSELPDVFFSHCYILRRRTIVLILMRSIYLYTVPMIWTHYSPPDILPSHWSHISNKKDSLDF